MKRQVFFILVASFVFSALAAAQTDRYQRFELAEKTKVWFDGTSTLHDYTVHAPKANGFVMLDPTLLKTQPAELSKFVTNGELIIPVLDLQSGKGKMDRKMYKAMDAKTFPSINFKLNEVKKAASLDTGGVWAAFDIRGNVKIAGVEKEVTLVMNTTLPEDGILRAEGQIELSMKDFGVKPPSMFLGTVKTGKRVTVFFDLWFKNAGETSVAGK